MQQQQSNNVEQLVQLMMLKDQRESAVREAKEKEEQERKRKEDTEKEVERRVAKGIEAAMETSPFKKMKRMAHQGSRILRMRRS